MANIVNKDFMILINLIESHRQNAYHKVNEELVTMYYEIGEYLSNKVHKEKWGLKRIENLSRQINNSYPSLKGFNKRGLYRMIQFYETYKDNKIVSPLVTQISWTNNLLILSHKSSIEEKEFYIRLCIKNHYSKRELERQIESHYYERYVLSENNIRENFLPIKGEEDYPNTRILDQYSLEFLDLPNNYSEKDLKTAIIDNLKDFILEIGKDFSFIEKEHRICVGDSDFYIDLLFFNRTFSCLVAFELKVGEFKPEYVSKMDFYLEALDRNERHKNENPSVGVILCTSKNNEVVEYTLSRTLSPTMIAEYNLKLIDKNLLTKKLREYAEITKKNID